MSVYSDVDAYQFRNTEDPLDESLTTQVSNLAAKVAELKRYAQHWASCQVFAHPIERLPLNCTCGLENILK